MTFGYLPVQPTKPPISIGDLIGSIAAPVLTFIGGGVAAFFGVFVMAFTDYCLAAVGG